MTDEWDEFKADSDNANKGTERGKQLLRKSFQKGGAGRSIFAARDGTILGGNKSAETARELGIKPKVVHTDGSELVVVVRDDLESADDPKARELAYSDNRSGEVNLNWDIEQIERDWHDGVDVASMWSPEELSVIIADYEMPDALVYDEENPREFGAAQVDGVDVGERSSPGVGITRDERDYRVDFHLTFDQSLLVDRAVKEAEVIDGFDSTEWLVYMASVYLNGYNTLVKVQQEGYIDDAETDPTD